MTDAPRLAAVSTNSPGGGRVVADDRTDNLWKLKVVPGCTVTMDMRFEHHRCRSRRRRSLRFGRMIFTLPHVETAMFHSPPSSNPLPIHLPVCLLRMCVHCLLQVTFD
jgi:hypothetical protein